MEALKALVRYISYLFHGLLALFLLALSSLSLGTGPSNLHLGMLPWTGATLCYVLLFGSLFGLASVVLAMRGRWPALFLVWALAVAGFLLKGYVFSGYRFAPGEASRSGYLLLAALFSIFGAWFAMRTGKRKARY